MLLGASKNELILVAFVFLLIAVYPQVGRIGAWLGQRLGGGGGDDPR